MNNKVLHQINYGMYIVCSKRGEELNGQVVNTAVQITSEPATLVVSINKQNLTHEFIQESKAFSISILQEETPMTFIGRFGFKSGRNINKFEGINFKIGSTDVPLVLDNAVSYLECNVINSVDVGTHTIFIGSIVNAEIIQEGNPMTYDYYHKVKKGSAPQTAPTYIKKQIEIEAK